MSVKGWVNLGIVCCLAKKKLVKLKEMFKVAKRQLGESNNILTESIRTGIFVRGLRIYHNSFKVTTLFSLIQYLF